MSEPAWHADPTGRHQLRYYDGSAWTDHVSDNGVQSTDPVVAAPQPVVAQAPVAQAPVAQAAATPEVIQTSESMGNGANSKLPWIIGAAVAVAVVVGLVFLVGGGDDGGNIDAEGELAGQDIGRHSMKLSAGEPFRFRVVPLDPGMDVVVNIVLTEQDAKEGLVELANLLKDSELLSETPFYSDLPESPDDVSDAMMSDMMGGVRVDDPDEVDFEQASSSFRGDRRGRNDAETDWSLALVSGTYHFLVTDLSGDGGRYRIVVETTDRIPWTSDGVDTLGSGPFYSDDDFYDFASDFFSDLGS